MVLESSFLVSLLDASITNTLVDSENLIVIFALSFFGGGLSLLDFFLHTETSLIVFGGSGEVIEGVVELFHRKVDLSTLD